MAKTTTLRVPKDKVILDPFRTIRKVQWGGNWMVIVIDLRVTGLVVMNVELILPSQTIDIVQFDELPESFFVAPYTITAEGKAGRVIGEDGANAGFGVRNFPGEPLRGASNCQLWLKLDGALPKTPFPVTFNYSTNSELGSGEINLFYVATVKGDPKTGGVLAGPNPLAFAGDDVLNEGQVISLQTATTNTFDETRSFSFTVDPSTLDVGEPTG
jgi:hypothetical protein